MKVIFLLLSIILMLGNTSCIRERRCEKHTQCATTNLIIEYFGNYKPDNYWIFENQDGTKRDSIYVTDYFKKEVVTIESSQKDQSDCIKYDEFTFNIHSEYWGLQKVLSAEISNSGNCGRSKFDINDTLSFGLLGLGANNTDDTFLSTTQIFNFNTYSNKSVIYPKGFRYPFSSILATPKIGIVQFVGRNSTDTFSLIKYYIK